MFKWHKKNRATVPGGRVTVPVITLDGPSGSGKGTIARRVAEALGYHLLDSGALYRLVALAAEDACVALQSAEKLAELARNLDVRFDSDASGEERVRLGGQDVTGRLRTEQTGAGASTVAQIPAVREALFERQRAFARPPGLVADGRDMGTVVFPDARFKFFLYASPEIRAQRRYKQLINMGLSANISQLQADIAERDERDQKRDVSPLVPAEDALVVESSLLDLAQVTELVLSHIREKQ